MKQNTQKEKLSGAVKFLLIVAVIYIVTFVANFELAQVAIMSTTIMLAKILPILVIVYFIMVGVNLAVGSGKIKKYLGESSGISGWINAIFAGILISGPPYILYPLLKELKEAGMKDSLIAVFLFNRNVKIPFIPIMIIYFGLTYTIIISLLIIVFSVFNGMLIGQATKNH